MYHFMEKMKSLFGVFLIVLLLGCNNGNKSAGKGLIGTKDSLRNVFSRTDAPADDEFSLQNVHRMEDNETYPHRLRLIHEHLDSFLKGEIEDGNLEPYRNIVENKFYIIDLQYVMAGGIFFKIVFPKHPYAEFVVSTSIDVDDNDSITAYHMLEIKRWKK